MSMACPELVTTVTEEEAFAILEPWFLAAQEVFVEGLERLGFSSGPIQKVHFVIDQEIRDKPRHFAGCLTSGLVIYAAPEMVELSEGFVGAIFLHEFGHAADFLYPARFRIRNDQAEAIAAFRGTSDKPTGAEAKSLKAVKSFRNQWENRDRDTVEVSADKIAELVSGRQIGYRGPCTLQHLGGGKPRPRGLR